LRSRKELIAFHATLKTRCDTTNTNEKWAVST
jgi:hypothetical protein